MYKVVFRLGLLAFTATVSMEAVKILCAFSEVEELKTLEPPDHSVFIEFRLTRL
jgi:hypothetical protein